MAQRKNALKLFSQEGRPWLPADAHSPVNDRWIEFTVKSMFEGEPVSIRCNGFRLSRDTFFDKRGRLVDAACVDAWRPWGLSDDEVMRPDREMAQMLLRDATEKRVKELDK